MRAVDGGVVCGAVFVGCDDAGVGAVCGAFGAIAAAMRHEGNFQASTKSCVAERKNVAASFEHLGWHQ